MSVVLPLQALGPKPPFGLWAWVRAHVHRPRADALDRTILLFAVAAPFTNIPQLLNIYVQHRADLSLVSWTLYAAFNIPLFVHGWIRNDKIILFNSSLTIVMQLLVIAGILLYA